MRDRQSGCPARAAIVRSKEYLVFRVEAASYNEDARSWDESGHPIGVPVTRNEAKDQGEGPVEGCGEGHFPRILGGGMGRSQAPGMRFGALRVLCHVTAIS